MYNHEPLLVILRPFKTKVSKNEFKVLTRLKQVELLLEEKSLDCHLQDSEGRTGLMVAAMEGRLGVVKLILRYWSSIPS